MPNRRIRVHRQAETGFTAIELLVTVAVVAILAALAAPSFKPLIDRWRVRDALESMQSTLYLARSEAIKRGGRIAIQKLPNVPASCSLAGTNEEFSALGWFLSAAVDDRSAGNSSFLRFSPWLIEEVDKRCEAGNVDFYDFLRSLLPSEKRHLTLPEHRTF